jgi:hypothetical protein
MSNKRWGPPEVDPSGVESKHPKVSMTEAAMNELAGLVDEVTTLANAIRDRISIASDDSQVAWIELDREIERFRDDVAHRAAESVRELREVGFSLKRRLDRLLQEIKPT